MRFALVNPDWRFEGSIYFGCREPHLPLEFGYSKALLEQNGHQAAIFDGQLDGLTHSEILEGVKDFGADVIVVTTAPSYLFWRCPPPELKVPQQLCHLLRQLPAKLVVVGPHGSTTPRPVLRKANIGSLGIG